MRDPDELPPRLPVDGRMHPARLRHPSMNRSTPRESRWHPHGVTEGHVQLATNAKIDLGTVVNGTLAAAQRQDPSVHWPGSTVAQAEEASSTSTVWPSHVICQRLSARPCFPRATSMPSASLKTTSITVDAGGEITSVV